MRMMMTLAAIAATMTAAQAQAAVNFSSIKQEWSIKTSAKAPLKLFDSALGTLERVTYTIDVSGTGGTSFTNKGADWTGTGIQVSYAFGRADMGIVFGSGAGCPYPGGIAPKQTVTFQCNYVNQTISNDANRAGFIGKAGDVFTLTRTTDATLFTAENATVTLNYFYTPAAVPPVAAAVPEPATWAMMASGFAMIGAAARRRRRATLIA